MGKLKKRYSCHKNDDQIFSNLSWIFVFNILTSLLFGFWNFLFFKFMKLWNVTWGSTGNHKMWNILKTAGDRGKRTKILDSRFQKFLCMGNSWDQVIWVQFRVRRCKIFDAKIFKRVMLPQFSYSFNQILQKVCMPGKYKLLLFLPILQILKVCHLED